jgi:F-type H+-transporting ATPase subunit a
MHSQEFPNVISLLAQGFAGTPFGNFLEVRQNVLFSFFAAALLGGLIYLVARRACLVPGRAQSLVEMCVGGLDDLVCGIIGPKGRTYTPFIGTLFLYILFMNLLGFIPFMKSPTASWSVTLALSICVFCYVQYTAFKELGVRGYLDHLMGKPRGVIALSVVLPVFMLISHVIAELVRPLTLSLRLRSNIWGDDMMMVLFAGFGLQGLPLLFLNTAISIFTATIQAFVFSFLSTIYFALVLIHED